ncbi:hypothetical protein SELMODRAFT_408079 [Selaginella moellendorffii]|uniref:Uncharacterized protein n=1 Tax=Selaginella moellendorffii TaxID=88036 RepID=D8R746_SELML|nr:hypothetical protein SELMODRAFT_408079 [Selaginella moellendorffii]
MLVAWPKSKRCDAILSSCSYYVGSRSVAGLMKDAGTAEDAKEEVHKLEVALEKWKPELISSMFDKGTETFGTLISSGCEHGVIELARMLMKAIKQYPHNLGKLLEFFLDTPACKAEALEIVSEALLECATIFDVHGQFLASVVKLISTLAVYSSLNTAMELPSKVEKQLLVDLEEELRLHHKGSYDEMLVLPFMRMLLDKTLSHTFIPLARAYHSRVPMAREFVVNVFRFGDEELISKVAGLLIDGTHLTWKLLSSSNIVVVALDSTAAVRNSLRKVVEARMEHLRSRLQYGGERIKSNPSKRQGLEVCCQHSKCWKTLRRLHALDDIQVEEFEDYAAAELKELELVLNKLAP